MRLRFADCVLDDEARELRRAGCVVPLSPRAYQLLTLLLEQRPRPLPQPELRDALWPDAHVGYSSLAQVVTELRRSIGDTARGSTLVRTVPRYGYAFAAAAVEEDSGPVTASLAGVLVGDDREYPILEGETLVGRGTECGVRLPSTRVSRVHARIRATASGVSVEDAGSKNGTWVNGERRGGPTVLREGDEVLFGTVRVVFQPAGALDPTRTGGPV
jgi:DNA-binding winged helix-turn-helix (wHTH) protein